MQLDFAREYAGKTDDELRLLIQDRHDLIDEARDALDAEVAKRKHNGFQVHVQEPEEPRLHVDEDEDGNEVVVHSRELRFPKICPRCLAPADSIVEVSCNSGSTWGFILALDMVRSLWGYLFYRYSVPFCRNCARSVRVRRWVERLFILSVTAASVYLGWRYHRSAFQFVVTFAVLYLAGVGLWMVFGMPKQWPPAGIDVLSNWSSKERRLQFAKPEYEKAFVALNGRRRRR